MFVSGIGGLRVFSIEKKDNGMSVVFLYLNEFGKEIDKTELLIEKDNGKFIFVENKGLNRLMKKQLNNLLKNIHSFSDNPISKIDNIKSGADTTQVIFKTNKKEHRVLIDWFKTKDLMEVPAPNMNGDYVISPRINDEVFNSYFNYLQEAKDDTALVVAKMNLILFFESFEQQRTTHLMNVISGIFILRGMFGAEVFKKVNISGYIKKDIKFDFGGNIEEYTMEIKSNLIIDKKDTLYHIIDNGIFNENDFYSFLNTFKEENIKIYKYKGRNTNRKSLINSLVIEKGEEILAESDFDISKFIPSGRNIIINAETFAFEEVFSIEEIFEHLIAKIEKIINFIENK